MYKLVNAAGEELAKDAEGAYRNYDITKVEGVLKVNPVSDEVVVTIAGQPCRRRLQREAFDGYRL